jgi:hypothetical protein
VVRHSLRWYFHFFRLLLEIRPGTASLFAGIGWELANVDCKHLATDQPHFVTGKQHDVLMARVSNKVHDKRVLELIGTYLGAGAVIGGCLHETRKGVLQGGPLSPLLSNILLHAAILGWFES